MARRDRDELREPAGEAGAILGPQLIVKEHPHGVEPDQPARAQLAVDASRVVGSRLPHLELIDGVRRDVVRADEPALRLIPPVGAVGGPPHWFGSGVRNLGERGASGQKQRKLEGGATVHRATVMIRDDVLRPPYRFATNEVGNRYAPSPGRTRI